jgi:DNA-binding FadR family transcriptional regulator
MPDQASSGVNLHRRVLMQLGTSIVKGELAPGSVLNGQQLAAEYGVSRSVVREVVRALESMNLIESKRRVGLTVLPRSQWNLFDRQIIRWRLACDDRVVQLRALSELRSGIEPIAAGLAARNATPEDCGELTRAVIGMSVTGREGDLDRYLQHDIAFHSTLLAASGNEMFASLAGVVAEVLAGRTEHHLMPEHPEVLAINLHRDVADAVQIGDTAAAREAMEAILAEATAAMFMPQSTPD